MWSSRRKGQTAIEVLFITAVILTGGVLVVIPPYLHENTAVSIVSYVKSSASDACAYLNAGGVVTHDDIHDPPERYNNRHELLLPGVPPPGGVRTEEVNGTIKVDVKITYTGGAGLPESTVERGGITQYIKTDVSVRTDVEWSGGELNDPLYLNGKKIEINVDVVRE